MGGECRRTLCLCSHASSFTECRDPDIHILLLLLRSLAISLGGMESDPMLTPREKSSQREQKISEEGRTHDARSMRTASPTHYQRAIPAYTRPCPRRVTVGCGGPPRWPSGKASASRAEDPRFESRLRRDFFRGRVIPVTQKLALQWLPCQAPGVIGSALGLVGPVSVYCDWVR